MIRDIAVVPDATPLQNASDTIQPLMPHSEEHGSVKQELAQRALHDDPEFIEENSEVFTMLKNDTRGTAHTPSLGPYRKKKDGCGAYFALVQHFAGKYKWQRQVDDATDLLVNTIWKGQNSYPLASFVATMREKWMDLEDASKHVPVQIPSEYMRVGYLLDHIQ